MVEFFSDNLNHQCIITTESETILKSIQDYIIFLWQMILDMNHKIFIIKISLWDEFIHLNSQPFQIQDSLIWIYFKWFKITVVKFDF